MDVTPLLQSVGKIGDWANLPFFTDGEFATVCVHLLAEGRPVLPEAGKIFRAFELTKKQDVRVVILGQDPYPDPLHATGLAFAVPNGTRKIPPSLNNMFKELRHRSSVNTDLEHWALQGVLLLNTTLTIPVDLAGERPKGVDLAHAEIGWHSLISQVTTCLAREQDVFFIFLGVETYCAIPECLPAVRRVLTCHPSRPGSKTKHPDAIYFKGSDVFGKANNFLRPFNRTINW